MSKKRKPAESGTLYTTWCRMRLTGAALWYVQESAEVVRQACRTCCAGCASTKDKRIVRLDWKVLDA